MEKNMSKIAAGYRFTFNSSDIRSDNSSSIIKEGLTENETNLFVELSEQLQSNTYLALRSSTPEWRIKKEHEKLYNILDKYSSFFTKEKMDEFKEDVGAIMDYISENMLGYSSEEGVDMRVLDSYKIEDIPQDIILNDVTSKFQKHKF